jgi:predicted transcriptional regulator
MTLTFSLEDITFVVACVALAVTLFAYVMLWRRVSRIKLVDSELDARALVQEFSQRSRRLEERFVDQKVRLEILELRQQKQNETLSSQGVMLIPERSQLVVSKSSELSPFGREIHETSEKSELVPEVSLSRKDQRSGNIVLVRSELEALKFVLESGSKGATSKDIQRSIGRSREHTARMMNGLFKEGLVERNSEARPFTYRITEEGKQVVKE